MCVQHKPLRLFNVNLLNKVCVQECQFDVHCMYTQAQCHSNGKQESKILKAHNWGIHFIIVEAKYLGIALDDPAGLGVIIRANRFCL